MFIPFDSFRKDDVDKIPKELLQECPVCRKKTCYYLGVTPISVKCANKNCRWYEKYEDKEKNKEKPDEKEIEEDLGSFGD
jgi:hypothetical protein